MATPEIKQIGDSNIFKVYVRHDGEFERVISQIAKNGGKIASVVIASEIWQGDKERDEMGDLVYIVMR